MRPCGIEDERCRREPSQLLEGAVTTRGRSAGGDSKENNSMLIFEDRDFAEASIARAVESCWLIDLIEPKFCNVEQV